MICSTALLACLFAAPTTAPITTDRANNPDTRVEKSLAPRRYWVYFKGRGMTEEQQAAAISDLERTYPAHAVERRRLRRESPGLFDERDLPVAPAFVATLRVTGCEIWIESSWLNAVSVKATEETLAVVRSLPFVASVEPVRAGQPTELTDKPRRIEHAESPTGFYGLSEAQLTQINLVSLHEGGTPAYRGQGVIVGILDTGFVTTHEAFNTPGHPLQIVAARDFINQDDNVGIEPGDPGGQHSHGTLILGVLASYKPDTLVGGAYEASFVLCKTEDIAGEYQAEEDNYVAGLQFAELHGADVVTSSLGYIDWYSQSQLDGQTAVTTIAVNIATDNGVYCCTAAGNGGHDDDPATSRLIAPADAFKVFTCGAVNSDGVPAGFTSDGPSADGRVKPEITARGVGTVTVHPDNDTAYVGASGTSLSTPVVACAIASLAGARPWWPVDHLRELIFSSASLGSQGGPDPLFIEGYGLLNAAAALALDCPGDYNGDAAVDFFDYLDFAQAFSDGTNGGDFNRDGQVDFFDYLDFVGAFSAPC